MIDPIPVNYDGCRFRSTREFRWAVFFNTAKIPWEYEPQGYDLGDAGAYLPDFRVNADTHAEHFFEVKGKLPTQDELAKAGALCVQTQLPVYVYYAQVRLPAPPGLAQMTREEWDDAMEQHFNRDMAREFLADPLQFPGNISLELHHTWADDCEPTACVALRRNGTPFARQLPLWWMDCPHCGLVVPKLYGQVGCCPATGSAEVVYPNFAHATRRLQDAYNAARSARPGR